MWVLSHHHHLIPLSGWKPEFDFVKHGIWDLFEMEEEVETNINLSISESRVSRSTERSFMRSSSSRSRFPLVNKNKSSIN